MIDEVLDVLQEKRLGLVMPDNTGHIEEKRSLDFASEPMRPLQGIFLGDSCNRERLARKTREQHVVSGNVFGFDLRDISGNGMVAGEVCEIGFLGVGVPLACEETPAAERLEALAKTADTGEQVHEPECRD